MLPADEDRERAAALGREVLHLEVLDVDPLRAERLEDPGQDARPVGDVDAQPLQRARVVVGRREQAPAVAARLGDPAGEEARVAGGERCLELLDPAAVLAERGDERVTVVEEDVHPDAWVGAGDARHVPERAAGGLQRVVPVDTRRAGLVQQDVRERVRQVARHRHEPVVRAGVDRDRPRPERRHESVQEAEALRLGRRRRREEPRRALEQLGGGTLRPPRLRPADRVPADEARIGARGGADGALRRADVGDGAALRRDVEDVPHLCGQRGDRRRDERELGVRERRLQPAGGLDGAALGRHAERVRIGIPAGDRRDPGGLRRETGGRADETRPDDGERAHGSSGHSPRRASARRRGTRGRATAGRSAAGRRASRSGDRAAPRARSRSRRDTPSRSRR